MFTQPGVTVTDFERAVRKFVRRAARQLGANVADDAAEEKLAEVFAAEGMLRVGSMSQGFTMLDDSGARGERAVGMVMNSGAQAVTMYVTPADVLRLRDWLDSWIDRNI